MLFEPLAFRGVTLKNRIVVSPMCQYSCGDGFANDWHLVHQGSRAVGGAALVMTEATAVEARGRISPQDLGLWKDEHIEMLGRITRFIGSQGAVPGIQLAHSGRKGSTRRTWEGEGAVNPAEGGWAQVVAPSAVPFARNYLVPEALSVEGIAGVVDSFVRAAARARAAGYCLVEIHAAHGYLLDEFLSPAANKRTDSYGGTFENRIRMLLEVVRGVRGVWPDELPLFVRISATDWLGKEGWDADDSVALARILRNEGVDCIDCSSGGMTPDAAIPVGPGYQVRFAERIRREAGIPTAAVGMITSATQAETILMTGQADLIVIARQFLRDPYWPLHAAAELGEEITWPPQYHRAAPQDVVANRFVRR